MGTKIRWKEMSLTGKMAQWVKALVTKPDNQSSVPEVHIVARENLL